jgi:hypothetical protein
MRFSLAAAALFCAASGFAQTTCPPTPRYSPCDIVFDVAGADPAKALDLHAEVRSPHHDTVRADAFWDGGTKWVTRVTPTEDGEYTFRVTGSVAALNGKQGTFKTTPNNKPGWLRAANLHHWAFVEGNQLTPHLWMGGVVDNFAQMDAARWNSLVDNRAAQHFNHLAITLVDESAAAAFRTPEFFRAAEEKIRYANDHGIIVDIAFFGPNGLLNRLLPTNADRRQWFANALARLTPFDVTWQGLEAWETYDNGRALLKEIAEYLTALDPYKHTRSSRAQVGSASFTDDGWLRYRSYQTADDQIAIVDQQIYQFPAVNNFGAGLSDDAAFRRTLWRTTMAGQYPATAVPNEAAANAMKIWYEFITTTRHWELEPWFDVENGRALALDGIEYIVYVEKPGTVNLTVEPHGYDAEWINPATGEHIKSKEKNKGENYTFTTPDSTHDWILHVSREGTKAGMLKSVKYDSREVPAELQVPEGNPEKIPFDIIAPAEGETLSLAKPAHFAIKLKRDTRALRDMVYEWTAEVTTGERGYRVAGTGPEGTLNLPANLAPEFPALVHLKIMAVNGLGKLYIVDRNYTLTR